MQRRPTHPITPGRIRLAPQQFLHDRNVAALDREVQRSAIRRIRSLDIGSMFEQQQDDLRLPAQDRLVEERKFCVRLPTRGRRIALQMSLHVIEVAAGNGLIDGRMGRGGGRSLIGGGKQS
jgi:hypothetical protein